MKESQITMQPPQIFFGNALFLLLFCDQQAPSILFLGDTFVVGAVFVYVSVCLWVFWLSFSQFSPQSKCGEEGTATSMSPITKKKKKRMKKN